MSKKQKLLIVLLSVSCMTCCISLAMTFIITGMNSEFLITWMRSWRTTLMVALPLGFVIPPFISKLVMKLEI